MSREGQTDHPQFEFISRREGGHVIPILRYILSDYHQTLSSSDSEFFWPGWESGHTPHTQILFKICQGIRINNHVLHSARFSGHGAGRLKSTLSSMTVYRTKTNCKFSVKATTVGSSSVPSALIFYCVSVGSKQCIFDKESILLYEYAGIPGEELRSRQLFFVCVCVLLSKHRDPRAGFRCPARYVRFLGRI